MDQQSINPEQAPLKKKSNHKILKSMLLTIGILLVIAASSYAVYKWQHDQLTQAQTQLTQANSSVSDQKNTVAQLNSQITSLKAESKQATDALASYESKVNSVTQSDLNITVNGAQYVNPGGTVTASGNWFGINITVTNPTTSSINLALNTLQLKDVDNNSYSEIGFGGSTTLPIGWVDLASQTLAPGTTVKGVVIFQMPNKTVKNFNFINNTKSYPVTSVN